MRYVTLSYVRLCTKSYQISKTCTLLIRYSRARIWRCTMAERHLDYLKDALLTIETAISETVKADLKDLDRRALLACAVYTWMLRTARKMFSGLKSEGRLLRFQTGRIRGKFSAGVETFDKEKDTTSHSSDPFQKL